MGQATSDLGIAFHVHTPVGDGLTSVMSDPIEELSPDEFWAVFVMDLRNRRHLLYETQEFQAAWDQFGENELLVQDPSSWDYLVWQLNLDTYEVLVKNFGEDASLKRPLWRGTLKVHREPFRIEFWRVVAGRHDCGAALRDLMKRLLETMRSKAACTQDAHSLSEDGLKSVLSDPIVDSVLSPTMFWKQTKELILMRAFKTHPDGSVVQKTTKGWGELWNGSETTYTRHFFNEERKEIISSTYTESSFDESSLEKVRHLRVHEKPFRLEMWTATPEQRRAGEEERSLLLALLEPTLQQARLISDHGKREVDSRELSRLREEVDCFRSEVSDALRELRAGALELDEVVLLPNIKLI